MRASRAGFSSGMDVLEAVRTLLAVREYTDRPLPADVVEKIVEAGHLTASSINKQPWHFVVVQERQTLRRLAIQRARLDAARSNASRWARCSLARGTASPTPESAGPDRTCR